MPADLVHIAAVHDRSFLRETRVPGHLVGTRTVESDPEIAPRIILVGLIGTLLLRPDQKGIALLDVPVPSVPEEASFTRGDHMDDVARAYVRSVLVAGRALLHPAVIQIDRIDPRHLLDLLQAFETCEMIVMGIAHVLRHLLLLIRVRHAHLRLLHGFSDRRSDVLFSAGCPPPSSRFFSQSFARSR